MLIGSYSARDYPDDSCDARASSSNLSPLGLHVALLRGLCNAGNQILFMPSTYPNVIQFPCLRPDIELCKKEEFDGPRSLHFYLYNVILHLSSQLCFSLQLQFQFSSLERIIEKLSDGVCPKRIILPAKQLLVHPYFSHY